jgi:hypothetical protein
VVEIVERPRQLWEIKKMQKAPTDVSVNPSFHGYGWQKIHNFLHFFGERPFLTIASNYHYLKSKIC